MTPQNTSEREQLKSHNAFRKLLPKLLEIQEERQDLAIAALANPILALEELGYVFSPKIRRHMVHLARFGEEKTQRLKQLEAKLRKELGKELDLDDAPAVARAVLERVPADLPETTEVAGVTAEDAAPNSRNIALKRAEFVVKAPPESQATVKTTPRERLSAIVAELPQRHYHSFRRAADPLTAFKGVLPAIDDLIEWREIEGSRARFATPEIFRRILNGELTTPITRVRFRQGNQRRES